MSKEDFTNQFLELSKLAELNEADAVLLVLELAIIPLTSFVYKHDTASGNPLLTEYNELFAKCKEYIKKQLYPQGGTK